MVPCKVAGYTGSLLHSLPLIQGSTWKGVAMNMTRTVNLKWLMVGWVIAALLVWLTHETVRWDILIAFYVVSWATWFGGDE